MTIQRCRVKRQRHPDLNYKKLGVEYMDGVRRRPPWVSAMQGITDVNTQKTIRDGPKKWLELVSSFPTNGVAEAKCRKAEVDLMASGGWTSVWGPRMGKRVPRIPDDPELDEALYQTGAYEERLAKKALDEIGFPVMGRSRRTAGLAVCSLAQNWKKLMGTPDDPGPLVRCDRRGTRNILVSPSKTKTISGDTLSLFPTGWAYKSVDMLLLDLGCPNVAVADLHMLRLATGNPNLTEAEARRIQQNEQSYDQHYDRVVEILKERGATDNTLAEKHVEIWLNQARKAEDKAGFDGEESVMTLMRGYGLTD